MLVHLILKAKDESSLNFYWPHSSIKIYLYPKACYVPIVLQKNFAEKDWGNFEILLKVIKLNQGPSQEVISNNPHEESKVSQQHTASTYT